MCLGTQTSWQCQIEKKWTQSAVQCHHYWGKRWIWRSDAPEELDVLYEEGWQAGERFFNRILRSAGIFTDPPADAWTSTDMELGKKHSVKIWACTQESSSGISPRNACHPTLPYHLYGQSSYIDEKWRIRKIRPLRFKRHSLFKSISL